MHSYIRLGLRGIAARKAVPYRGYKQKGEDRSKTMPSPTTTIMPETAAQVAQQATDTIHVMNNGEVIDPTTDKVRKPEIGVSHGSSMNKNVQNFDHWKAQRDPPPDVHVICFENSKIGYFSYDPPKGFSVEEIMKFRGATNCLTQQRVTQLIKRRDETEKLEETGNDEKL